MTASIIFDMKKFARIGIQHNCPNDTGRNLNSYIVKFNIKRNVAIRFCGLIIGA